MKQITLKKVTPYEVQLPLYVYDNESKSHYRVDEVAHIFDRFEVITVNPNDMVRVAVNIMGADEVSALVDGCSESQEDTFFDAIANVYKNIYKKVGKEIAA